CRAPLSNAGLVPCRTYRGNFCTAVKGLSHSRNPHRGNRQSSGGASLNGVIHSMKVSIFVVAALAAATGSACAESGIASSYSTREQGTRTSSGRALHDGALTAAHKTLPFGSRVRVTNRANGRSVVVTITDRGPFVRGRVIDLTPAGARAIGLSGLAHVTLDRS